MLHVVTTGDTPLLDLCLAAGFIATAVLLVLSVVAYHRRRTRSMLLLVAAFGTLCVYSLTAVLMLRGIISDRTHHLTEHGLIVLQSLLLLAAVYYARTVERNSVDSEETK